MSRRRLLGPGRREGARGDPAVVFAQALSKALNALVDAGGASAEHLAALDGRVLALGLRDSGHIMRLALATDGVRVLAGAEQPADVTITGSVQDFIAFARASHRGDSVGAGRIEISGDLRTAQGVQALLGELDVDLEAMLARVLGGVAARRIARLVRGAGGQALDLARRFEDDVSEFLRVETRLVPESHEIASHGREVYRIADDVERLEARLRRLEGRSGR